MKSFRTDFLLHIAQTSQTPLLLEVSKAKGVYIYDKKNKKYFDLISGIAVSNLGHCNSKVIKAVTNQAKKYLHVMVYGEYVLQPQVQLATKLYSLLPKKLNSVYFTNSGSEAVEGAIKLAKRYTGKSEIISFANAYHGSTQGALSIAGNEALKQAFRPLLPDITILPFNDLKAINAISPKTACVIIEPIQGEAGIRVHSKDFLVALQKKCNKNNALLIFDEAQTGLGRTGKMFAFEHFNIVPDILVLAKAFGGGLPLGAFIANKKIMHTLTYNPALGHITTFGGNPLCCTAALTSIEQLIKKNYIKSVHKKELLFKKLLKHPAIKKFKSFGLMIGLQMESAQIAQKIIFQSLNYGILIDSFLFAPDTIRIAPPLSISYSEIKQCCSALLHCINRVMIKK